MFQKSLIIGLGLIGGSFAKALHQQKLSQEIHGFDVSDESIEFASASKIIDGFIDLTDDLSSFDLVVIASPLSTYKSIFTSLEKSISKTALIVDLGSLKNFIQPLLPKNFAANFIACHPIAGSENSGFTNSDANLFRNKKFVICPSDLNQESDVKKIESLATSIGSETLRLKPREHDEIYALVSHLPQFLSFLTLEFSPKNISDDFFKTAFRLDNSNPEIWDGKLGIFKLNEQNLEKFYLKLFETLEDLIEKISEKKYSEVLQIMASCPRDQQTKPNQNFLTENFPAIFFRTLLATSYLKIPELKTFQTYAGSGFTDFTSITAILNHDQEFLTTSLATNQQKILKIFDSIS